MPKTTGFNTIIHLNKSLSLKSCIGDLSFSATQTQKLGVKSHTQISPGLEKCYLMVSADMSYQNVKAFRSKLLTSWITS